MPTAVVVGGGISGLVAALGLARAGWRVQLLEGSGRFGGKLAPVEVGGLRLDGGAESMLARRPEGVALATELGLPVVHPTPARPGILRRGAVVEVPRSVLGVPADLDSLAPLLTSTGLERARREPALPAPPLTTDVGIGALVADRFGAEVTDALVEPVLGGIYAGRSRELSFAAVNPGLYARARAGGSLLEHAQAMAAATPPGPVFAGVPGGVHTVVLALVTRLGSSGVELRTGMAVRGLERSASGWRLTCGPVPEPEIVRADAVVLAVSATAAGRLLADLVPRAGDLVRLPYASGAVVTMLVRGLDAAGSGLLVPPGELPTVKAVTYSSAKWDWVREASGDLAVVRASVGRLGEERVLQVDDSTLLDRTWAEVASLPGWAGAERAAGAVSRWGGSLAQYLVGHGTLINTLRAEVSQLPALGVGGAFLDGVGIAACIASADAAVAKVTRDLSAG